MIKENILTGKSKKSFDYPSRYSNVYYYYNTVDDKFMYGRTKRLSLNTEYVVHDVSPGDTFDSIALKYYGRPDLYWVIADFNREIDVYSALHEKYKTILVPSLSNIKFI